MPSSADKAIGRRTVREGELVTASPVRYRVPVSGTRYLYIQCDTQYRYV